MLFLECKEKNIKRFEIFVEMKSVNSQGSKSPKAKNGACWQSIDIVPIKAAKKETIR